MDKKISQLTAASTPLTGAEELAIVQSGVTKKTTIEDVKGYKVYTALLTQSGGDDPQEFVGSGTLTVGVTYLISDNASNPDFTNVGAPNNNVGTYFVATGTTPNSWGEATLGYNTGAPVVTVLENTIGNIWFEFYANGQYKINSNGLLFFNSRQFYYGLLKSLDSVNGYIIESDEVAYNDDFIQIITQDGNRAAVNGMEKVPIEIRVYN